MAIPDLVRVLDFGASPANFRAAAALGRMGKTATPALPDLERATRRGGLSEPDSRRVEQAFKAIEAIGSTGR